MNAPHRRVRLLCEAPSGPIELMNLENPSIPRQVNVTDPRVLELVRDGTLDLLLEVSQRTDVQNQSSSTNVVAWRVEDFDTNLRGHVAER
jgi:hypothetical protein